MRRFLLELQFYGRKYAGFQKQGNTTNTVQTVVETALEKLFLTPIEITGCSRTDAGVSAEQYFCHFDADTKLPAERVCFKLNRFLPIDIQAISSKEVAFDFDARKNVTKKTYSYTLYRSEHRLPLYESDGVRVDCNFNLESVKKAAACLQGTHDFAAFRTLGYEKNAEKKNTVRTLYDISFQEDGKRIKIYVTGNGFLYNMVRIIVGTLVEAGEGKRTAESVKDALESKQRIKSGKTMPPKGLKLYRVEYLDVF